MKLRSETNGAKTWTRTRRVRITSPALRPTRTCCYSRTRSVTVDTRDERIVGDEVDPTRRLVVGSLAQVTCDLCASSSSSSSGCHWRRGVINRAVVAVVRAARIYALHHVTVVIVTPGSIPGVLDTAASHVAEAYDNATSMHTRLKVRLHHGHVKRFVCYFLHKSRLEKLI